MEVAEYFADLHNRIRVIDFHDQRTALDVGERAAYGFMLAVAKRDDGIDGSDGMHGVRRPESGKSGGADKGDVVTQAGL